jgi:4-oxalocrotonate tautomerase
MAGLLKFYLPSRFSSLIKELFMPFANYKFPEGILDAAKKEEIIHRTTAMFVEYFGEGVRPFSMVLVDEVADGGWGRADETLTMEKMGIPRNK